ncbi:DnaJ domain protein [Theileria parva strain Muguga]|uniref:DnaJ domain protein n=1 Tax=Theileria parva strain Muguga TaxID=333668 RepID=UPI001C61E3E9|nr:DnaJ domain protein [Theileria parva strain Muguga]KAF5153625.1 DnaJ domain protein [Theileria parva strain Muguga]
MERYISLIFVLSPVIRFLCNPERKWNQKRRYTGRFLTYFLIFLTILYKLSKKEKNCFQLLNVSPFSSFDIIRKSFKTVAFNLHPDRNTSKTSTTDYSNLVEKYKFISSPDNRYKYTRFYDLVRKDDRTFHEISILDLISLSLLKSFVSITTTFFMLFTNGEKVLWHPLLVYAIFMMFFDLYLRLSDELFFTTKLPFIRYYVTFEILMIFNEIKAFFIHYSTLFPDDSRILTSIGATMLSNNLKVIDKLDSILNIFNFPAFSKDFELEFDKEKVFGEITEKVEETRNKIMKIYNEKFDVSWSRASKRKYEKLSRIGERFTMEPGSILSFLFISAIIILNLLK